MACLGSASAVKWRAMSSKCNSLCRLCHQKAELLESHIIPKFAIRWMKETGTGYLRRVAAPNVRLQDGVKERLLCASCEQLFAVCESYFATQVFRPMLAGVAHVPYDERLAYFVVSLLWRSLQRNLQEAREAGYPFLSEIEEAEQEWRRFLLGRGELCRFGHLHLFLTDLAVENPPGVPQFNLYCMRACDATFFDLEGRCYVVAKLARFFFIGILTPYSESDWKRTRVLSGSGALSIPQQVDDRAFGGWLMARAKFTFEQFDATVSSNQQQMIRDHIHKKMPKLKNSDVLRAATADMLDRERVLSNASKTGRNDPCPCGSGLKFKKCHGH